MSHAPVISIIIVSYAARDILRDCLASVQREADVPCEVIVVDNESPDGSPEMVEREFPSVRLIRSGGNIGFSPANNIGLEKAKGAYMLLLNPDTVLRPSSLSTWLRLHKEKKAGISGPRLLNVDGTLQPSAWKVPGLGRAVLELFYLHRFLGSGTYPTATFGNDFEPGFVSGAAMLFHRTVHERVGGLDPHMFWCEDVDLCLRVKKGGDHCWYFHAPEIIHIGGQSSRKNMDRVISNQLISRIKLSSRHSNSITTVLLATVIILHAFTRALAFGLIGLFRPESRARAYRYALRKLGRYLLLGDRSI